MSSLRKPRAILFYWDNTLVNTWPMIHTALNMTLRHMGHPEWTYERVRGEVKKSMRDSFPEMFGDRWKEAADMYQQSYRSLHLEKLQPLPGAANMLAAIPPEVFVAVVSNKHVKTTNKWRKAFDAIHRDVSIDDTALTAAVRAPRPRVDLLTGELNP
mgnify:CR=1 FL=1